jgi:hypothetical protein
MSLDAVVQNTREYIVDTGSRYVFYVPTMRFLEKVVVGSNNERIKDNLLAATVTTLFIGYAGTLCRRGIAHLTQTTQDSPVSQKKFVERTAGVIAGTAGYLGVMWFSDASFNEAGLGTALALTLTLTTGYPYGQFNDWVRRRTGLSPILHKGD